MGDVVLEKVPPPWDESLPPLLAGVLTLPSEIAARIPEEYLRRNADEIQAAIHWVIRLKWNSKHKVPGRRAFVTEVKPTGEWLKTLLNLCMEAQTLLGLANRTVRFNDAAEWFTAIIQELLYLGKQTVIVNLYPPANPDAAMQKVQASPAKKRSEIDLLNAACSGFKDLSRPTDGVGKLAFADLVSTAKLLAEENDLFRKQVYMPFCAALRAMIAAMSGAKFASLGFEDGQTFEQKRGREKRVKR